MKTVRGIIGVGIYWSLWPVWYLYFKLQPVRSRVLVVAVGEVLILRSWISDGKYGLPGGGKKRHETAVLSAVRELEEETGIDVAESALSLLGKKRFNRGGISYQAVCFALRLDQLPELRLRKLEILDARFVPIDSIPPNVDPDTIYALKRYEPVIQESLL